MSNTNIENTDDKKLLTLYVSNDLIEDFKDFAFAHYQQRERLDLFGYSHYLKICLLNFEKYLLENNIDIVEPTQNYLDFYSRKGNINTLNPEIYSRENVSSITFSIDTYHDMYYMLMHTYFLNFLKGYKNYSTSFFFYDLLKIIHSDNFDFTQYDITD